VSLVEALKVSCHSESAWAGLVAETVENVSGIIPGKLKQIEQLIPLNNLVSHYGRAGGFVIRLDRSADMRKGRSVSSHPILADH
jgi:hypothetical protein